MNQGRESLTVRPHVILGEATAWNSSPPELPPAKE
jgi:hypothetical protein